ncbi:response regulator receiver modulated metal dependent phosphohydrolase [Syntrophobotulus glycolicus DSM 8271]|uniref:Stage 0 sporulation protein A homolog n=1 Tax=Syntrophobotulus glycolicus (strain DSM 8271 / FlGlyR) TaxID=645991 RepID=F0T1K5_SYNGF|nr:HD domain-containing phosphohydrolase [Syntrophobotulus glycolicus]ADY57429.1 response regulator receiver modulated metal dependent phosphohydrolase [Syntrophobotulus glycolicus DSM 8271]
MRRSKANPILDYKILVVDDEQGIVDSLSVVLKRSGYQITGLTDPLEAIEKVRQENFDLLILDFLMFPIHGDKVVEKIRQFNTDIYILMLTGHKDLAPPLETIKALDIQGYCEKGDRLDQLLLLVESGIKSISQMRTIRIFQEGLNKILQAVPKIYQLQPIDNILEDILSEILPLINSKNAFILVDDVTRISSGNNSIYKGIGKYKTEIEDFMVMLDPSLMEHIGSARVDKKVVILEREVIIPLINELQQDIGVIYVEGEGIQEGSKLLEIYASQAASSISNAFLHSLVNIKNDELNMTYDQLKERYMDTIEALRLVVDAKDIYTRGHSERVAYFAVKIGQSFGLSQEELELLRISGIFHDVGKIGTSDDILFKSEKLDEKEYEEIKKHPLKGAHILSAISMFKEVVPIVKCHHERVDGKGYPEGLKKEEIPFLARIISVADAFDAMMSDRHYRSKLKFEEARAQLLQGAGTQCTQTR